MSKLRAVGELLTYRGQKKPHDGDTGVGHCDTLTFPDSIQVTDCVPSVRVLDRHGHTKWREEIWLGSDRIGSGFIFFDTPLGGELFKTIDHRLQQRNSLWISTPSQGVLKKKIVYYESIKRELMTKPIYVLLPLSSGFPSEFWFVYYESLKRELKTIPN